VKKVLLEPKANEGNFNKLFFNKTSLETALNLQKMAQLGFQQTTKCNSEIKIKVNNA
jgi:hypothetical protein